MKPFVVSSVVLGMSLMLIGELSVTATTQIAFDPVDHALIAAPDVDPNALVSRTCVRCHSDSRLRGNLSLEDFDIGRAAENAEIIERMIRKVRAGMMPPPGTRAPAGDTLADFAATLEQIMDDNAERNPNPGRRTFQRLNRPEYERAIRDLLDLEVRADDWLPLDQMSANFDNIADVQSLSPTLLEAYLNAAADISRMAVGRPERSVDQRDVPQLSVPVPAPLGSCGGGAVRHERRDGVQPRLPGRRHVSVRDDLREWAQRALRGHRYLRGRRAGGAHGLHALR